MKITINEKELSIKQLIITIVSIVVLFAIVAGFFFTIGNSMSAERAAVNELVSIKKAKDEELTNLNSELEAKQTEIKEMDSIIQEVENYKTNKNDLEKELNDKKSNITSLDEEIANKENEVSDLQAQLDSLNGDIEEAIGEPIHLPAGNLTVGKDIEPGRYSVSGESNFIVYSILGDLKVNTILGGSYGVESYVCELETGDEMECHGANTFTPID